MATKHNSRDPIGLTIYRSNIDSILGKNFFEHRLTPTEITTLLREFCRFSVFEISNVGEFSQSIQSHSGTKEARESADLSRPYTPLEQLADATRLYLKQKPLLKERELRVRSEEEFRESPCPYAQYLASMIRNLPSSI
jgi:hypothetical protein